MTAEITSETAVDEARTEAAAGELGKARLRKEDERLITGQTNWTDNIQLPGMLHIAFLRSPYAHARITSVDVSAARNESCSLFPYALLFVTIAIEVAPSFLTW